MIAHIGGVPGRELTPTAADTIHKWCYASTHAIVETKTAQNALEVDQIEMYLDLARELEFRPLFDSSEPDFSSPSCKPIRA